MALLMESPMPQYLVDGIELYNGDKNILTCHNWPAPSDALGFEEGDLESRED
jgi:hypothetical protein